MKQFSCLIVLAIALSACGPTPNPEAERQLQDSLLQVQQDSLLEVLREELSAIDKTINEVSSSNGIFDADTMNGEVLSRDRIIGKVEALDNLLKKSQGQLDDMYNRMRASKLKNEKFERMIQSMQDRVAQRESKIGELMTMLSKKDLMIEDIRSRVDSMRNENIDLTEDLMDMEDKLHTVYYVVGEAKDLKSQGIVSKEGGVLGFGASKELDVSSLDGDNFEEADMRDLNEVLLYVKKANLITNHPKSSYSMVRAEDGTIEKMTITDKAAFWKASDYLVVEVSN